MIGKIINNKYIHKTTLADIRLSKDKAFYIWSFEERANKRYVGFTPATIYYGGKTHLWYSLLTGYFLPPAYNINFDGVIGKECYVVLDSKGVVRGLVPLVRKETSSKVGDPPKSEEVNEDIFQ